MSKLELLSDLYRLDIITREKYKEGLMELKKIAKIAVDEMVKAFKNKEYFTMSVNNGTKKIIFNMEKYDSIEVEEKK